MKSLPRFLFAIVLLVGATGFALCAATGVETLQQAPFPEIIGVNTTFDANTGAADDAFPGDGQCETAVGNGVCTLRAAIEEANAHAGGDGIFFSIPTTDPGYSNGTWTINLTKTLPAISDSVNINGPGADKLQILGRSLFFGVFSVTASGTVSFNSLTIANGYDPAGGGIYNQNAGTVNVTKCILNNNHGVNNGGGAIYNNGTVNVTNCILSSNSGPQGGGIYSAGTANVTTSTFSSNGSTYGGGIYNAGTLTVSKSTFMGNTSPTNGSGLGGGIYNGGTAYVTNSTFSGNSAPGGAGIYNAGTSNVSNSTIARNTGGGISNKDATSCPGCTVNIKSTIVALNQATVAPDVSGRFSSSGFNLIGESDGSTGFTQSTDQTGTIAAPLDPGLNYTGLQDNGGPTDTLALLPGSPAIDKGTSSGLTGTLTTDQRGVGYKRTIEKPVADATGGDGTDVGAYEVGAQIRAISSKAHGSAGTFKISLPLVGPKLGVECRSGGASGVFKVILTFPSAVTVSDASVTPDPAAAGGTGSVSSLSVSGSKVTVNLTGVSNAQTILINLFGVSDGTNTNDVSVPMGVLLGDVTGDGSVTSANSPNDVTLTKSKVGQAAGATNFREDVNTSGAINSTDVNLVQSQVGMKLP